MPRLGRAATVGETLAAQELIPARLRVRRVEVATGIRLGILVAACRDVASTGLRTWHAEPGVYWRPHRAQKLLSRGDAPGRGN